MEVVNYNGTSLAFIGDAWMSLQVRLYMLEKGSRYVILITHYS